MESFGVPVIKMMIDGPNNRRGIGMPLNRIGPQVKAAFMVEDEAKAYVEQTTDQIREAMRSLREQKDDFSSTQEVEL